MIAQSAGCRPLTDVGLWTYMNGPGRSLLQVSFDYLKSEANEHARPFMFACIC